MGAKPTQEFRFGKVKASVWVNNTDRGVNYNVEITRFDKIDGEWRTFRNFGKYEILPVAHVAQAAANWIMEQESSASGSRYDSDSSDNTWEAPQPS